MNDNRNITITRRIPAFGPNHSTLTMTGNALEVVGNLPHASTIEPAGPDDAAKLLFYADRHLKLAEGLADALRENLARQSEHDNPDYYDHQRALERYDHMRHKLTPED